jgi:hypothetical protein
MNGDRDNLGYLEAMAEVYDTMGSLIEVVLPLPLLRSITELARSRTLPV